MPRWIESVTESAPAHWLARVLLTSAFWWSGIAKLSNFDAAVAEMQGLGLAPAVPIAALTITVQLLGSALVIAGRAVWLGAGMLAVFTLAASAAAHAFWTLDGVARTMAVNTFLEHLGLVAGFFFVTSAATRRR
jgi:uncharacterized membrane protein YphA (DoxX/SURF4 family)